MVHPEVSFITYSALSIPPYFFAVHFVVTFERLAKTFQFLKMIHDGNSRSYINLFLIYTVARKRLQKYNLQKYKNSFDSSKERLDTKILIQDRKNLPLVLFYCLKT